MDISSEDLEDAFSKLGGKIEYRLHSGWTESLTGLPRKEDGDEIYYHGRTNTLPYDYDTPEICFAYETLSPLLRDDLTSGERKQLTWIMAAIMLVSNPTTGCLCQ